jgi:uncharacterized protein (TIGR03067 family)
MSLFAVLITAGFLISGPTESNAEKKQGTKLQGTWVGISAEEAGKKEGYQQGQLVFDGDRFTARYGGRILMKGTFKIDPSKKPGAIDLNSTEGRIQGQTAEGIYEVNGDTLRLGLVDPGKPRPTKFTRDGGVGHHVLVYKRNKSD